MGGKALNSEMYEKIITDRLVFGKPATQIAQSLEKNAASVSAVVQAFEGVRDSDWDKCIQVINAYKAPLSLFAWAAQRLDTELPPTLEAAYEERKARKREYDLQKRQQAETPKAAPAPASEFEPIPEPEPKKEDNTGLYLIKLLEAVNRQNELLEQLYDVVIPKWVGDMKDNVNCNSDVISQNLKRIDDKLEAIKINVRKRGL